MSIAKIIKTGLAIYGGAVLAKKLGRYIFVKNKEKIVEKVREKVLNICDKAIDDIFKEPKKVSKTPKKYKFDPRNIYFRDSNEAFAMLEDMAEEQKDKGCVTVTDFINSAVHFNGHTDGWGNIPRHEEDDHYGWDLGADMWYQARINWFYDEVKAERYYFIDIPEAIQIY